VNVDFAAAALAAQRTSAAYIEDAAQSRAAFSALGDTWIDMTKGVDYQAVLSADAAGATHLTISGTRASQCELVDVFDDVDVDLVPVAGGAVTAGVLRDQDKLWKWALSEVDSKAVINVAGHSLGAARTHLVPLFLPIGRIGALVSLEAPKFADAAYYASHAAVLAGMVCVLNGRDAWASWPWFDHDRSRPLNDHIWLQDVGYQTIPGPQWPGGWNFADHGVALVGQRLAALSTAQAMPARIAPAGLLDR
jgi:hypothetical protein